MTQIKFGTDGWRGVIADDFTFENVRRVAGAIASYVLKHEEASRGVVVGYDTRFASPRAAEVAAEVLAGAGIPVVLAGDYTPTPAVSYAVKQRGAAGGVMITSSHNPFNWNGVKFKGRFGGSATPAIIRKIEDELHAGAMPRGTSAKIERVDLKPPYVEAICQFADLEKIAKANFKLAIDTMHGSGRGVLAGIFDRHGVKYVAIRGEVNPLFPGINPEPIEPHVALLQETVVREGCHAGLATDGDADRIGAVAEDGSFVDSHKCFSVLLRLQHHPHARPHRRPLRAQAAGVSHRLQVHRRPDDGAGDHDRRRRIRRHRLFALPAGARRHSEFAVAGQRDGR
jgi:phosphomannomutase